MSVKTEPFGSEGSLFTLQNARGTRLVLTDIGASVVSLVYEGVDVALGWAGPEGYYRGSGYIGVTVGRNCNRIADAAFTLNGKRYVMEKNDGENNLHSGPDSYATRRWQTERVTDDSVAFLMDSPNGDQGFPGRLVLTACYRLTEDDRVELTYRGRADADTLVNITNPTDFKLNGPGRGDIHGHILRLYASRFTPARPGLIPTGEILAVKGTPYDFTAPHPIGRDIDCGDPGLVMAGGYDHNYLLDGEGFRPAAELTGDKTGVCLTVFTDRPALQVYTGNSLTGDTGKGGAVYARRGAVCLETQQVPNAVNESAFPSPVVKAGESYEARTVWQLKKL